MELTDIQQRAIEALETTSKEQTTGRLRKTRPSGNCQFCCLGVIAEEVLNLSWDDDDDDSVLEVYDELTDAGIDTDKVVEWNDNPRPLTFNQVAAKMRENPEEVFLND